jgi:hypothetical protein
MLERIGVVLQIVCEVLHTVYSTNRTGAREWVAHNSMAVETLKGLSHQIINAWQ